MEFGFSRGVLLPTPLSCARKQAPFVIFRQSIASRKDKGKRVAKADQEKTYEVSADQYFKSVSQYEKYPEHVEGMKSVRVERNGNQVIAHYDLSMMGKDIKSIVPTGAQSCKVHYAVEVEFNFPVPGFLLKGVVKSTLPTMMNSFFERAKKL